MESRKIFYKHRGSCFFQPSAYVLAATLVGAPLALLDAILYGSTSYMANWFGWTIALHSTHRIT
jgi:hypothetical protein